MLHLINARLQLQHNIALFTSIENISRFLCDHAMKKLKNK